MFAVPNAYSYDNPVHYGYPALQLDYAHSVASGFPVSVLLFCALNVNLAICPKWSEPARRGDGPAGDPLQRTIPHALARPAAAHAPIAAPHLPQQVNPTKILHGTIAQTISKSAMPDDYIQHGTMALTGAKSAVPNDYILHGTMAQFGAQSAVPDDYILRGTIAQTGAKSAMPDDYILRGTIAQIGAKSAVLDDYIQRDIIAQTEAKSAVPDDYIQSGTTHQTGAKSVMPDDYIQRGSIAQIEAKSAVPDSYTQRGSIAHTGAKYTVPDNYIQRGTIPQTGAKSAVPDDHIHRGSIPQTGAKSAVPDDHIHRGSIPQTGAKSAVPDDYIPHGTIAQTKAKPAVPEDYSRFHSANNNVIHPSISNVTQRLNQPGKSVVNIQPRLSEPNKSDILLSAYLKSLEEFDGKFYECSFLKLSANSPPEHQENGISFVQSGLFLHLLLTALAGEAEPPARAQIEQALRLSVHDNDKIELIRNVVSMLPKRNTHFKFLWSSHLLAAWNFSSTFRSVAEELKLQLAQLNGTETPDDIVNNLNEKVLQSSGGALHDTFDTSDVPAHKGGYSVTTMFLRSRWRAAPTLLNGTHPFHDGSSAPPRTARMIRINDIMGYAHLPEWDAEAVEIPYSTSGLSLLAVRPRALSLRPLAARLAGSSAGAIAARMRRARVAVTLPLFTLRMTLLLPNKLADLGIKLLVDSEPAPGGVRLAQAAQRLMFWSETGRNAFKDDGLEWEPNPELQMRLDRPYAFYVRWRNITLMHGNFVL